MKSVLLVDASKRPKKVSSAPMFTANSVLASTHACASPLFAVTLRSVEASRFRNTVEDTIFPNAERPMSTWGIRWPVTLTDALASVMLGLAETVTAVALR